MTSLQVTTTLSTLETSVLTDLSLRSLSESLSPFLTSRANCQNRVVLGPPRLEPELMKAMFISLCPPEPTINSITSLILHCITVYYYSPQWKFPTFHGSSWYQYAHFLSSLVSLWCLANAMAINNPICSN